MKKMPGRRASFYDTRNFSICPVTPKSRGADTHAKVKRKWSCFAGEEEHKFISEKISLQNDLK